MSNDILDAVRAKYPQYSAMSDQDLTVAIGKKYPAYLQNPAFALNYAGATNKTPAGPPVTLQPTEAERYQLATGVSDPEHIDPSMTMADIVSGRGGSDETVANIYRGAAAAPGAIVNPVINAIPGGSTVTAAIPQGGRFLLGAMADLASTATGTPSVDNLRKFANSETMPVEEGLDEMHGLGGVPSKAAAGLIRSVPAIGASIGLGGAGVSSAVAAGAPMTFDQQGQFDPYGALIASGLPGVSGAAEKFVGAQLANLPTAHVVAEVMSRDPLQIKAKVVQRLGGMEISNDVFRKYLEAGGGAVAANAYLLASQAPAILNLPPDQRGEAIMNSVAGNLATSMLAFSSRPGASETLKALHPKLQQMWQDAQNSGGLPPIMPELTAPGEEPASPETPSVPTPAEAPPTATAPAPPEAPAVPQVPVVPAAPPEVTPQPNPVAVPPAPIPSPSPAVIPPNPTPTPPQAEVAPAAPPATPPAAVPSAGNPSETPNSSTPANPPEIPDSSPASPDVQTPTTPAAAVPAPVATTPQELNGGNQLADTVKANLAAGNTVTPAAVNALGAKLGLDERQSGEWAELAGTEAARNLAQSPAMTDVEKFHALVSLYDRMPTNGTRTVESKVNQQYSTPPPLAFVGGVLADFKNGQTFVEPTAGHGMAMIGANPAGRKAYNELDQNRLARLQRFAAGDGGQAVVTSHDATTPDFINKMEHTKPDRVGMNPPFGTVLDAQGKHKEFPVPSASVKYKTTSSIDTAVMLNTFNALTPDGKGYAIIGAKTGTPWGGTFGTDEARADGYRKPMFLDLFHRFKVVDWFTIGGDLYRKMGAAWPVDMIVVHGKGKTPSVADGGMERPWVKPPRVIETWEQLAKLIPTNELDNIKAGGASPAKTGGSTNGARNEPGTSGPGGQGKPEVSAGGHQRPVADSGTGSGNLPGHAELPNPTPQPPASVPGDSSTGIGQGTPATPGQVAGGGTASHQPSPPAVGGARPVSPGSGKVEPQRPVVKPAVQPFGPTVKPSVPVEGLPASLMVKYQAVSKGPSLNLVAPRNIASQMAAALGNLEREVGMPVDDFVADRLATDVKTLHTQLSSAQLDAIALAIRNVERGSALITADETGVGKGRIVAALLKYAKARGLVPVFVTAKKNLYSDMVSRDLPALGDKDFKPFITDSAYEYEDGHGREVKGRGNAKARVAEMEGVIRTGQLPGGAHGIFTTYDQLKADKPAGWSEKPKEKFARKSKGVERPDGPRWAMLRAVAPRALFILDEAHLAAGKDSEVNLKFNTVLPQANGMYYSSATFAKRPDNLGLYALGTLMKRSGLNNEQLTEALTLGGVPMQQALTSMLAESGELVRRQQDWTGVQMRFKQSSANPATDIEAADTYTGFIRDLMRLAKLVNQSAKGLEDGENQVRADEQTVSVEPVTFGSRLFNLSNQYLLALRADAVVKECLDKLAAGKKPFVALYNTMEGPILDLKAMKLPVSFNGMLLREMHKMLTITVRDPMEESGQRKVQLQPEDLPDGGAFYRQLETSIKGTDLSRFPISPIDYIKKGLTDKGYKVGELTARDGEVDDSGDEIIITKRDRASRNAILKDYNDGKTDVIIVNGSGSTGLSAHTDPRFKDQRQRAMVVAQPAPDINEFMQMIGRVMRSGQTSKPEYTILNTALAAERRFATMLRGKMTSLNANTTAEGESGMTQSEGFADDIFNKVGDDVVTRVMAANPEATKMMELPDNTETEDASDGFARTATGRFVLLPNAMAHQLWDEIIREYRDEIAQLDEQGQNPLRATAEDLRAKTLESTELAAGTGNTPFDGPAMLEKVAVKPPKAPPTHAEAMQRARDNQPLIKKRCQDWLVKSKEAEEERVRVAIQRGDSPDQINKIRDTMENVRQQLAQAFRMIGDTFGIDLMGTGTATSYGVGAEIKLADKALSDFSALSRQQLILTTNTYQGKLTRPLSKLFKNGELADLIPLDDGEAQEQFDKTAESSAERYVVTGNLLRGWEAANSAASGEGKPRVTIYTKDDGTLNTGVLMPAAWEPGNQEAQDVIKTPADFVAAVRGQKVLRSLATSPVHPVVVKGHTLIVPSSAAGRSLWGDPAFKSFFTHPPVQQGSNFVGTMSGYQLPEVFAFLQQKGIRLMTGASETAAMSDGGSVTTAARGAFVSGVNTGPGKVPAAVQFGGMQFVRPLQLPELVRLTRELSGAVPGVSHQPTRGNMKTYGKFSDGMITLDPLIFKDPLMAAQVLGHELGHLVDYLPHGTLRRGNLLGHLLALRGFLKQKFGPLNNKELRNELLAVTMWWRPYDPVKDPKSYVAYRQTPEELYADALSVLFNAPAELENRAPKFYEAFWKELNARPDVQTALFQMQDLLNQGMLPTAKAREEDLLKGFKQGEATWKAAVNARQKLAGSFSRWWERLAQDLYWGFYPLEKRAATVESRGVKLAPEEDPRKFLDDLGYKDTTVMRWGRHMFEKCIQPIEQAGMTLDDAGKFLFYTRVLNDRSGLANPGGMTPDAARLGLLKMTLDLGLPKMTLLRDAINVFHDDVYKLTVQAVACGAYNKETFENVIMPNKASYATFAVLDYLDDYLPAGIKQQIGTFKGIANPFQATILKSIGLINVIATQQAKNKTVDFLQKYFADEIQPAGEAHPTARKDKGIFMRLENGRPRYYYTDPYIADAFDKTNPRQLWPIIKAADWAFRKLVYPFIITYNPAFLYLMQPGRDLQRTARNLPGARVGVGFQPLNYLKNIPNMTGRFKGEPSDIIREMEANLGIASPFDMLTRNHRDDFMGDLLRRMNVLPQAQTKGIFASQVLTPVRGFLDRMEFGGNVLIDLSRVAAYTQLRKQGKTPGEAAYWTRNYSGIPNLNKKGLVIRQVRALVPFWNVFMQGWRADLKLATNPTTRSGWWLRYMMGNGMARVIIAAAAAGALGTAIKELYDGIGSHDKANYLCIPVGQSTNGDFGKRTVYVRLPEDFTARMIGGMIQKGAAQWSGTDPNWSQMLDFGMGQFPELNPAITVPEKWAQYAKGQDPEDDFRGQPIISDRVYRAHDYHGAEAMAAWTLNQTGVLNLFSYNPQSQSTTELGLSAIPGINKFVKVTDQGYREAQRATQTEIDAQRDMQFLKLPDKVQSLELEYWRLAKINADTRTAPQEERLNELKYWYQNTYRPAWGDINDAVTDKNSSLADQLRKGLATDSSALYRGK